MPGSNVGHLQQPELETRVGGWWDAGRAVPPYGCPPLGVSPLGAVPPYGCPPLWLSPLGLFPLRAVPL